MMADTDVQNETENVVQRDKAYAVRVYGCDDPSLSDCS